MHFEVNIDYLAREDLIPYLIAPGSTVTSAAAISVEILKVLESTILTVPPLSCVGCTCENEKANGLGMTPFGLTTSVALSEGGTYIEQWLLLCAKLERNLFFYRPGRYIVVEKGYGQRRRCP